MDGEQKPPMPQIQNMRLKSHISSFFLDFFLYAFYQVLRVEGVETEGSIVVDPEISFNK